MKHPVCLGYQIATPEVAYSPDLTCLWGELEPNVRLLAEIGYDAVEFMTLDPSQLDPKAINTLLEKYHMRTAMVCTGELFGTLRLSFLDDDPEIRQQAAARTRKIIDFAAALKANINIGRLRGSMRPPKEENLASLVQLLKELADYAAQRDVCIFLEPIEKAEINFIHTIADGAQLCALVGSPHFKVMKDCCAMYLEEPSLKDAVSLYAKDWVGHVHLTENDRYYPGHSDSIPFKEFIGWLKESGYVGPFVIEVLPLPDAETSARLSFQTIAPILRETFNWEGSAL